MSEPTAANDAHETDEAYRLTEADWEALTEASFRGGAKAWRAEVERIVAERVRVVEGERDAARREERMRAEDHANAWREVAIVTARAESAEAAHAEAEQHIVQLTESRDRAEANHEALVAAVEALTWFPAVRDTVSGKTRPPWRKTHVRVRDIDALLAGAR